MAIIETNLFSGSFGTIIEVCTAKDKKRSRRILFLRLSGGDRQKRINPFGRNVPSDNMRALKDLKAFATGFIPGWAVYNKRVRGADYSEVAPTSWHPEIAEIAKDSISVLVAIGYGPAMGALTYGLFSLLDGATEVDLKQKADLRKLETYVV
jgi:hypothetical protein